MLYTSTRDNSIRVTASQAIAQGISEEGGLFVPCELPKSVHADRASEVRSDDERTGWQDLSGDGL